MLKQISPSRRFRALACESLEPRFAMTGAPTDLVNAQSLTLSFAPDGTSVSGQASSLEATLTTAALTQWRQTIVRAFQTWAQAASINIGVVADSGEPLGIQGASHDDHRFGDIRIAGVPLSPDTYAEAIHESRTIVGTWAGDVIFNTSLAWNSEADLYSIALHEAGHVLGLDHSPDPLSPMFKHGVSQTAGPTAGDIVNLQAIYGARRSDVHEISQNNDSIARSTRIPHAEATDGFDGQAPLVVYGDIRNASDKDMFELPVLVGYNGSLSFDLVTRGISLLAAKLTLLDRNGNVQGQVSTANSLGDKVTVQIPVAAPGKYYLQVDSPATDAFSSGSYAIVTKYDGLLTVSSASIDQAVQEGFRWQARSDDSTAAVDVRKLLVPGGTPQLENDFHQNDTSATAVALQAIIDSAAVRKYQYIGTISDPTDVDLFRIRSQNSPSALRGLTITVESLEQGGVIPVIRVLDKNGAVLPVTMLANGNGQVLLRAEGIQQNLDYLVEISSGGGTTGNYALTARFDDLALARTSLLTGNLSSATPYQAATLYVARPQLFSFALQSQSSAIGIAPVWVTVFDDKHRTVAFLGSEAGSFRTGSAVILQPGAYYIQVEGRGAGGTGAPDASFTLFADHLSDPVGPPVLPPGTQPAYPYDPLTGLFIFPNLPPTPAPVVIAPPPALFIPPPTAPIIIPPGIWFWAPAYLPTNPSNPLDSSGDGTVTPLDALIVINFLNRSGSVPDPLGLYLSNYVDTSADGIVSPLDALLVINRLNSSIGRLAAAPEWAHLETSTPSIVVAPTPLAIESAIVPAMSPLVVDLIFEKSPWESVMSPSDLRRRR